jgi:hypothetical protein
LFERFYFLTVNDGTKNAKIVWKFPAHPEHFPRFVAAEKLVKGIHDDHNPHFVTGNEKELCKTVF